MSALATPNQSLHKQPNSAHCFICGVQNVGGVHVRYYETTGADGSPELLAVFTGRPHHQGYPDRLHGGVITGVLDETIGRAINIGAGPGAAQQWGVTVELEVKFLRPAPLDLELTARGRITNISKRLFAGTGELYLPDGSVAATAVGKFVQLPLDQIAADELDRLGWRVYPD
ncbi:MAG: PaaI family thioesterase [Caldilineaceae bacterium]